MKDSAGVQRLSFKAALRTAHMPGDDVSEHGIEFVAHKLQTADIHEESARRPRKTTEWHRPCCIPVFRPYPGNASAAFLNLRVWRKCAEC